MTLPDMWWMPAAAMAAASLSKVARGWGAGVWGFVGLRSAGST